jgi:L-glyceraldehyde reductase
VLTLPQIEKIIKDTGVTPAMNQIERHPRLPNTELVDYCISKGIFVTAYSAFGNNNVGIPLLINDDAVKAQAERLSKVQGKDVTPAHVILAWAQLRGQVVIPKSVTPSRIAINFQEYPIDDEAAKALDAIGKKPSRLNIPYNCESFLAHPWLPQSDAKESNLSLLFFLLLTPVKFRPHPVEHQHLRRRSRE